MADGAARARFKVGWRARGPAPQYHAHCRVRRHGPARGHLRARSPPRGPGAACARAGPPPCSPCAACPRAAPPFRLQVCRLPVPGQCHLSPSNVTSPSPDVPPALRQHRRSVPRCATSPSPCATSQCRLSVPERTTCPLAMSLLCPQMCHLPLSSATFLSPDVAPALEHCHIPVPSCATHPHAVSHPCPQMCHLPEPSRCHPDHHQRYHLSLMPCTGSVMVLLPSVAPLHGISITISGPTCPLCHATLTCVTNL